MRGRGHRGGAGGCVVAWRAGSGLRGWLWAVLIWFFHVDDGRGGGRATLGAGVAWGWAWGGGLAERTEDRNGAAEAVEPLLLVEDVVDLQCVGLCLTWVLGTHAENVLGCR